MAVRLVQFLCPHRHCIVAGAYEEGQGSKEKTIGILQDSMRALGIEERCALCGSTDLEFEDRLTKYATMQEAAPALGETAQKNAMTRELIDSFRATRRN
jgi:hypothetical protein